MEIGSLQESATRESVAAAQSQRTEAEKPSQEREGNAEVSISQEARELKEQARAEEAANEQLREKVLTQEQSDEREAAKRGELQPGVIAVRVGVGPPPLEQQREKATPEEVVLQGLRDRSNIPQLDGLLEDDADDEKAEAVRLPGQGHEEERPRILGEEKAAEVTLGREDREAPVPAAPEAFASRDAGTRDRAVAEALQRAELFGVDRSDEPEVFDRATSVAPQVSQLPGTDDARRTDAAASERQNDSEETEERAREVLTLGGSVEASASDQLVTRFLGSGEREQPGPTPQAREELGERAAEPEPTPEESSGD
jgi:hypothetical protein